MESAPEGRPSRCRPWTRARGLGVLAFNGAPALFLGGEEAATLLVDSAATLAGRGCSAGRSGARPGRPVAPSALQFGKPIGWFQAGGQVLADTLVDVEG